MDQERQVRRLTTILAADVVGFSRLMGTNECGTLSRLKALRKNVIEPKSREHGGRTQFVGEGIAPKIGGGGSRVEKLEPVFIVQVVGIATVSIVFGHPFVDGDLDRL